MFVIIAYDVQVTSEGGAKRLRRIAKECVNYGQRVQNSVFEVNLEYGKFLVMKDKLENIMDPEKDSIRYYYLGKNWNKRVEHVGAKAGYDSEGLLLF